MEKILDIRNFDGSRRAEVWQNTPGWRILFFEHEKLVHNVDVGEGLRKAEILAEEFAYGRGNPQLLTEGKESI